LEKKIAILEKAIELNPESEELCLALLHTTSRHWSPDRMLSAWQSAIAKHHHSPRLWKEYVLFRQSVFSAFTVSTTRSVYTDAIKTLDRERTRLSTTPGSTAAMRSIEDTLVSVLVRACSFLRGAGQTERSIAIFQALVEFNLFRPSSLQHARPVELRDAFAEYWDSDVPRIGEPDAPSWSRWYDAKQKGTKATPITTMNNLAGDLKGDALTVKKETNAIKKKLSSLPRSSPNRPFALWLYREELLSRLHWRPLVERMPDEGEDPIDDDIDDDDIGLQPETESESVDRMVLWDDIKDFLFDLADGGLKEELALAFIESIGVDATLLGGARRSWSNSAYYAERCQELENFETLPGLSGAQSLRGSAARLYVPDINYAINAKQQMIDAKEAAAAASSTATTTIEPSSDGKRSPSTTTVAPTSGDAKKSTEDTNTDSMGPLDWLSGIKRSKDPSSITSMAATTWGLDSGMDAQRLQFARLTFAQLLVPFAKSNALRAAFLSFESAAAGMAAMIGNIPTPDLKRARALGQTMLAEDRANYRLYTSYAMLERVHGNDKMARRIYSVALSSVDSTTAAATATSGAVSNESPLIYWSYLDMELQAAFALPSLVHTPPPPAAVFSAPPLLTTTSSTPTATSPTLPFAVVLQILYSAVEKFTAPANIDFTVRPIALAKTRKAYLDALRTAGASMWRVSDSEAIPASSAACLGVCFAWLEYLTSGLQAALKAFDQHLLSRASPPPIRSTTPFADNNHLPSSGASKVERKGRWDATKDDNDNGIAAAQASDAKTAMYTWGSAQHEWIWTQYVRLLAAHAALWHTPPQLMRSVLTRGLEVIISDHHTIVIVGLLYPVMVL
jgi:hypothetical protein